MSSDHFRRGIPGPDDEMTSSSPHHTVTPPPATGCSADPVASELPAWAPTGHQLAVPQLAHALLVPVGTASTRCPLLPRSQHRATLFTPVKLFSSTSSAKRDWNRLKRQSRNPQRVVIFALQKIQKACHTVSKVSDGSVFRASPSSSGSAPHGRQSHKPLE